MRQTFTFIRMHLPTGTVTSDLFELGDDLPDKAARLAFFEILNTWNRLGKQEWKYFAP